MTTPGQEEGVPTEKRSRRWIWVSAVLAIVAIGLGIWAFTLKSDRDDTQQELDATKHELTSTKQQVDATNQQLATAQQDIKDLESSQTRQRVGTGLALGTAKVIYDEFSKQLGATSAELAATQQDVETANKAAAQAEKDAAAAKQEAADANNATDKAKAEADQAKAESEATQSKAAAAKGCAKVYIEAFGGVFESGANADAVRKDLQSVTADCKDALAAA